MSLNAVHIKLKCYSSACGAVIDVGGTVSSWVVSSLIFCYVVTTCDPALTVLWHKPQVVRSSLSMGEFYRIWRSDNEKSEEFSKLNER